MIDRSTNTMYLTARRSDGTIWLNALDITTGASTGAGAVQISATFNGLTFNQNAEIQRTGLLLQNGVLFLGFSALNCDNAGWHGWVLAYRVSDFTQVGVFATTSSAGFGAGIWASGTGLVSDGAGNIYFQTGNGSVTGNSVATGNFQLGESFVKLSYGAGGLTYSGSYTVSNWSQLNNGDVDLGSGGPLLLPGNRLVGGGKQGKLYVLNPATMTLTQDPATLGSQPAQGTDGFQAFFNSWHIDNTQIPCMQTPFAGYSCYLDPSRYATNEVYGPNIHSGLVYWNGAVYGMPEKDYLRSFAYNATTGVLSETPTAVSTAQTADGMPGGPISLSANGAANGIIWAQIPYSDGQWAIAEGQLAAFDAVTLKQLWSDPDDIAFPTFDPVTIADGKVFRPTFANELLVYGLTSTPAPTPCYTIAQLYSNFAGPLGQIGVADNNGAVKALPDGVGSYETFTNNQAAIFYSPKTCAHQMWGAIYTEYKAATLSGYQTGGAVLSPILGYPLTDEIKNSDGRGDHNDFSLGGSIYWSPLTGAHAIYGDIRAYWLGQGGISSKLGYPITDEADWFNASNVKVGRFNLFEHGAIYWTSANRGITTLMVPANLIGPQETTTDRVGLDFTHFTLPEPNPGICQERCAENSQCQAWTYVAPNTIQGPTAVCWLKGSIPVPSGNACCTSGIYVATQPANLSAPTGDAVATGTPFANFAVPRDPRLCQGDCSGNATCKAWTYLEAKAPGGGSTPTCQLLSTQPTPTASYWGATGVKLP